MRPTLRLVLLIVAVAWSAPPAAHGAEPTLEGLYDAEGVNPDGSAYRGVVKILRRGESFLVAWMFPRDDGDEIRLVPQSAGVGVMNGGMLAVSYYGQDLTGVALYQIENGGQRLSGRWVPANGDGAVRSETLTRAPVPVAAPVPPPTPAPKRRTPAVVTQNVGATR